MMSVTKLAEIVDVVIGVDTHVSFFTPLEDWSFERYSWRESVTTASPRTLASRLRCTSGCSTSPAFCSVPVAHTT